MKRCGPASADASDSRVRRPQDMIRAILQRAWKDPTTRSTLACNLCALRACPWTYSHPATVADPVVNKDATKLTAEYLRLFVAGTPNTLQRGKGGLCVVLMRPLGSWGTWTVALGGLGTRRGHCSGSPSRRSRRELHRRDRTPGAHPAAAPARLLVDAANSIRACEEGPETKMASLCNV